MTEKDVPAIPDEWFGIVCRSPSRTYWFSGMDISSTDPRLYPSRGRAEAVADDLRRCWGATVPVEVHRVGVSPDAVSAERVRIARAIEKALLAERKRCAAICEMHRQNILRDPNDPSFTEHLASAGSDICMGVEPSPAWLADAEGQGIPVGAVTEQVAQILGAAGLDAADGGVRKIAADLRMGASIARGPSATLYRGDAGLAGGELPMWED